MKILAWPFWNFEQRRLRALWRIALQLVFTALAVMLLSLPFVLVGGEIRRIAETIAFAPVVALLISFWLAGKWLDRRPFRDFGFSFTRRWWLDFGFGLALGAILMLGIFLVELAAGWVTITGTFQSLDAPFGEGILLYLGLFIAVGIQEELLSRGYWLRNLAEGLNLRFIGPRAALWIAYLTSSIIFGLLHLTNPNATWISTFSIVLAGLLLGLPFVLTGELAVCIGLHITWNFFQGNVFGFPVSGIDTPVTFIAIQQGGPDLITGGAFGPEAGIISLAAMGIGALLILAWFYRLDGRIALRTGLAEYVSPAVVKLPSPLGAGEANGSSAK
jgi:hypothetical protein